MKKYGICILLMLIFVALPTELFASVSGASIKSYETPFLLTSGGQGAGSKMLRLLINRTKQLTYGETDDFFLEDETPARFTNVDSGKFKALVVVMSVTEKGLGASGITIEDEIGNLKTLIEKAKKQNMPIIAVSLEADARAPKVPTNGNERVIDLVCPEADWIISLKQNDSDGKFAKIGQKYNIPVTYIDKALDLVQVLPKIFVKK